MKHLWLFALCILCTLPAYAQNIKGVVTNEDGEPVPGASIYIAETMQGTITNVDGAFQLNLTSGTYNIEVKSMGYETLDIVIAVKEEPIEQNIVLKSKDIQLAEVEVRPGEDPAYAIMREAIKKAPYYQQIIKKATFETYTKGSGKLTGVPALFNMMADKEDKEELEMYKDRLFLQESLTEVKFEVPDKYERTVIAFSSSMPFNDDPESAFSIGMISLYHPEWGHRISPLNPKAFSYYRFRYEGYEEEDGQIINIIRIIPKLKDPKLIEGIIHIADEEWSIRFIDYTNSNTGIDGHFILNFNHISDDVYLVTNYESKLDINLLGIKMNAGFLSSVQYTDIQLNDSLMMARQNPAIKPKKEKKEKKSLEIVREERKIEVDSLATRRDSLYWNRIRSIALNEEELNSYQYRDTLVQHQDSLDNVIYNPKFSFFDLIMGGSVGSSSSLMYFRYNGILGGLLKEYNFVDGWWMGQSFEFDFKKRGNTGLVIKPDIYWAKARKDLIWDVHSSFDYAPRRLGNLSLSFGSTTKDFAGDAGMNRFLNAAFTFDGGRNHARLYESNYISLSNTIDIANGLQLTVGGQYEKVNLLQNHTTWNLFGVKNQWKPNTPDYPNPPLSYDKRAGVSAGLVYTPEYYYRIVSGKKRYLHSRFPTFSLQYRHGFSPGFIEGNSHYNQLEFAVTQTITLSYFSRLNYTLAAGKFFGNKDFNYIDYKHFNTTGPWVSFRSWNDSYTLLPYYTFATNKEWVQGFINYNTDYLLLKRLPFLQGKMFTESLQLKYLYTPDKPHYAELGYGVSLPWNLGAAGVFVSFDKFKYNSVGFQLAIPLFQKAAGSREISISFGM
jgi:Nucleoside-binding outer membrane protein